MRIFSYIFIALVTIFVINIVLSFSLPAYKSMIVAIRSTVFPTLQKEPIVTANTDKKPENILLLESLDRIDKHIESLNEIKKSNINPATNTTSGAVILSEEESSAKTIEVPISGLFLAKIMPEITLKKIENSGFFDIRIMGKIPYSTYIDEKRNIKIYAFNETYDVLLLNMKLMHSIYELNETDQFFGFTFFLNPVKKDPKNLTIRFVTAIEGRALGIEVPKNYYASFKKILLKTK